jgi:toxin ParE1/3/4
MKRRLLIRPEAEVEIEDAYRWYEEKCNGLGAEFLLCLEEGIERIRNNPEMYPVVYRNIRRLLIYRFPYAIFYNIQQNLIIVLAVFHGHRDPKEWKSRI